MRKLPILLLGLVVSCGFDFGGGSQAIENEFECIRSRGTVNNGPLPDGCVKTEGGDLGALGTFTVGEAMIEVTGWTSKDGEPGEYIGFTFTASASHYISIKAGGETYVADSASGEWTHPAGTSGPEASAISNIVFCEDPPSDEPHHPGDPDDPGCPDPSEPPGPDGPDNPDDGDSDDPDDSDGDDPNSGGGDPNKGGESCSSNEECGVGICSDGHCVDV